MSYDVPGGTPHVSIGDAFRIDGVRLHIEQESRSTVRVTVELRGPDIETQRSMVPVRVSRIHDMHHIACLRADGWAHLVRQQLREALLHELDEHIRVDGERIFDPHACLRTPR